MEVIYRGTGFNRPFKNPVLTIGNFDGVHLGHQRIFQRVREKAREIGGQSVVYTFCPHPIQVLNPEREPFLLLPIPEKMRLIGELGMDVVICADFTLEFASLSAEEFVRKILHEQIGVREIYVGQNTTFGRGRQGNVHLLKELGRKFAFAVDAVESVRVGGAMISSSRIRELIRKGDMPGAASLLGRNHLIVGEVVHGFGRGNAQLGFPTANLKTDAAILPPKQGVYAGWAVYEGKRYPAVANLGMNPTFHDRKFSIEVHILEFNQDLYGQTLRMEFAERLRDEITFHGPEELIAQIKKDIIQAKKILGS